ncbi:MAG: aldehyde dehydrogenase family protein [Pseudomonadota bacterium]
MTAALTDKFYIDGRWSTPAGAKTMDIVNPATEATLGTLALGTEADVHQAVAAAKAAFPAWSATPIADRARVLRNIAEIYRERFEEIAQAISTEMGAPITFARDEQTQVGLAIAETTLAALDGFVFEEELPNGDTLVREPIGVCGLISPWNWPINQIALKVFPALAAGCTMVLKPSELTPLSAILFAEILDQAGVPPGVFNMVHGEGPVVGAALSRHPDVDMMSFTGSHRGGTAVTIDSAPLVKRVALELGGKSPNLIFADADLEAAVHHGVDFLVSNTGQSCDAPSRMLVEASVFEQVLEIAKARAESIAVDDPAKEGGHIGPLAHGVQYGRVQSMIDVGVQEGARVLAGGPGKPEGRETGFYVRPTVFTDVTPEMRIVKEEVFGPVLVIMPFADEAEGIALANETEYGLGAYLSTGDPERARRVARQLRAGTVNVNGRYIAAGSPFGGYKQSGVGREGGRHGIEEFLETKVITPV